MRRLAATTLAAVALSCASLGQAQPPPQENQPNGRTYEQRAEDALAVAKEIASEIAKANTAYEDERNRQLPAVSTVVQMASAVVVAIFTALLYGVATKQREITDKALDETRKAANAAETSANTAARSLTTNIALAQNDQRAWLGIHSPEQGQIVGGTQWVATVSIQNFGKTPARNVRVRANYYRLPAGEEWTTPTDDGVPVDSVVVLQPTEIQVVPVPTKARLLGPDTDRLIGRVDVLHLWVRVDYVDIFGRENWTTYHGMWQPESGDIVSASTGNDCN